MRKFHNIDYMEKGILHVQLKVQVKIFIRSKVMMFTVFKNVV